MMMESRKVLPAMSLVADNNQECRLCLVKIKPKTPVYNLFRPWSSPWEGMEDSVVKDLNNLTNIGVTEADFLSEVICGTCNSKLMRACQFVKLVHYNDAILKKRLESMSYKTAWPKPIQLDQNISYRRDVMDVEIKQEILSNDEYDGDDANSVDVEPEVIIRQTYSQYQLHTGDTVYHKPETRTAQEYTDEEYLEMVKEEQQPCSDSGLPPDCLLCTKTFKCVSGLKAHVIAQHSYKSVKRRARDAPSPAPPKKRSEHVCQICKRAFATSTDLMVHETCHNKWACYVCSVLFGTFGQLAAHRARCRPADATPTTLQHVKRQVLMDPQPASEVPTLTCPSCPEQFTDAYYMKIHTEIHHSASSNEVSDLNSTSDLPAPNFENGTYSTKESKNKESLERIFGIALKGNSAKDTESNDTQDSLLPNETYDDTGTNRDTESLESMLGVPTPENGNDSVDTNENLKYANNDSERINVVMDVNASVSEDNMPGECVGANITDEDEPNEIFEDNDAVVEDTTVAKHNLQEADDSVRENDIVEEKANDLVEENNVVMEDMPAIVAENNLQEADESVGENSIIKDEANKIVEENNVVMEDMTVAEHNLQEADERIEENNTGEKEANEIVEENNVVMKDVNESIAKNNLQEADESVGENNIVKGKANEIVEENNVVMEDMTVAEHNLQDADESVEVNNTGEDEANEIIEENNVVMEDATERIAEGNTPEADESAGENNTGGNVNENNDGTMDTNVEVNTGEDTVDDNGKQIQENNKIAEQMEGANESPEVTQTEDPNKTETESLECILGIEVKSGQINTEQNEKTSASEIEQVEDNAERSDAIVAPEDIRIESVTNNTEILESFFGIEVNRAKTDVPIL